MLYDVTNKPDRAVHAADVEQSIYIQRLKEVTHPRTLERTIKTLDEGIKHAFLAKGNVVWTKAGALFGHKSLLPKKRVDELWDAVVQAVGPDKNCLKAIGTLLMWRIAYRAEQMGETWLVYRRDSDLFDPDTDKMIKIAEYWLDNDFVPTKKASLTDLVSKFGKSRS